MTSQTRPVSSTSGGLIQDFTANLTTQSVTGLTALTSYAFAVVVRDAAGNKALYAPATTTTPDGTAPTPGTAISFSAVSTSSITVDWGAATDDTAAQASLQYKIVRATTSAAIDTTAEADAVLGADLLVDWTTNVITTTVAGLSAGDFHFYAVVVRDTAQNMALYAPLARVAGRMLYSTSASVTSNLGGATGADTLCGTLRNSGTATDVTPKAMLAVGATRRACTTGNCTSAAENVDWPLLPSTTYHNVNGAVVGTTNTAGIFSFPLTAAMVPGTGFQWHLSGMNANWTSLAQNCSGYTESSSATSMYVGNPTQTDSGSIYIGVGNCSASATIAPRLVCAEP